ncbi:MAG: cysteine hydrolase [Acidobacteriaceae bacterium]|nr:cysteine hydrolase [Acidobacteriaceae bacterium]
MSSSLDVQHQSALALVFVDLINHFDFPDGDRILRHALTIAPRIARLKKRAREHGIPVIYVNDNFGQWRSQASNTLEHCLRPEAKGRRFVEQVKPDDEDYLVLKPMHSAFYQTPLELLLRYLGAKSIALCGLSTNSCVTCTAHDAKMRDLGLIVVSDCCAARSTREHEQALKHIAATAGAKVLPSTRLSLGNQATRR